MTKFEEFRGKCKDKYLKFRDDFGGKKEKIKEWINDNPDKFAKVVTAIAITSGGMAVSHFKKKREENKSVIYVSKDDSVIILQNVDLEAVNLDENRIESLYY